MTTSTRPQSPSRSIAQEPGRDSRRPRPVSYVVLVAGLAFFLGPGIAALMGIRAGEFENRKLAAFPSWSDGWDALPQVGTWAIDHLPGREQAVGANNAVSQQIFGEAPGDTAAAKAGGGYIPVIQGKEGWLFLGDDVSVRCKSKVVPVDQVARMKKLADIVRVSGRTFIFTIAPDKTSVYPQYLPDDYFGKQCAIAVNQAFYAALAANPTPGYVDVRTPMIAAAAKSRESPLYRPHDSHWSWEGISIEMPLVANALAPELAQGTRIVSSGTYSPTGDLSYLLAAPQADTLPAFGIVREGVTMNPGSDLTINRDKPTHVRNRSFSAPLYEPSTLLLGDSFTEASRNQITPYFKNLTLLHNRSSVSVVSAQIAAHDTVIVQMGERLAITGNNLLLSDKALAAISDAVRGTPVRK